MKNYLLNLWYNTKLAYFTWRALKWNNEDIQPRVKVLVIMAENDKLKDFLNGNGEVSMVSNFSQYEFTKFGTMFPDVDKVDLILMKAEHDALNDNLI